MIWDQLLSFEDIKKDSYFAQHILWDIDPSELLEPVIKLEGTEASHKDRIKGYFFYIETFGEKPELFFMMHKSNCYGETISRIDEIPIDLLTEAVEENKEKIKFGMCPINEKIKIWLKKELGLL